MTDEQLSALLRLKRFETPPPGYYDQLLENVHRRQRAELLQRPLWRIAFERFQTYFGEHSMSPLTYAGAMASVVVAGFVAAVSFSGGGSAGGSAVVAANQAPSSAEVVASLTSSHSARPVVAQSAPRKSFATGSRTSAAAQPRYAFRYVIDAQPAAYAPPQSF